MPLLTKNKQVLFAPERLPGRAWPLTSTYPATAAEWDGGYAYTKTGGDPNAELVNDLRVINPEISLDLAKIDDEAASPSIGSKAARQGVRQGTMTFEIEVAGDSSQNISTVPSWGPLFQACMFRRYTAKLWTISGWSAVAASAAATASTANTVIGLTGTADSTTDGAGGGAGSGAEVIILGNAYEGASDTELYVAPINPADSLDAANDTEITISAPGTPYDGLVIQRTTGGAINDAAISWVPCNRGVYTLSVSALAGQIAEGTVMIGADSNCVIRVLRTANASSTKIIVEYLAGFPADTAETFNEASGGAETMGYLGAIGITSTGGGTITLGLYEDGRLKTLKGARGDVQVTMAAGMAAKFAFTFSGVYDEVKDVPPPEASVFADQVAPRVVGAQVFMDEDASYVPILSQAQLTIGNSPSMQEDATASEGIQQALCPNRTVTGSLDPEAVPEAAFPQTGRAASAALFPMRFRWGATGSNRFEIGCQNLMIKGSNSGDRGGKLIEQMEVQAYETQSGDEVYLLLR